jgi:hypothetical protein
MAALPPVGSPSLRARSAMAGLFMRPSRFASSTRPARFLSRLNPRSINATRVRQMRRPFLPHPVFYEAAVLGLDGIQLAPDGETWMRVRHCTVSSEVGPHCRFGLRAARSPSCRAVSVMRHKPAFNLAFIAFFGYFDAMAQDSSNAH